MFFRSCCILPLNLWDRTVEPKLPSISVPRRASSRAQQEGFIVLGPMLQGWQYVCLLSSGSWGVGSGGGVEREREEGGNENEIQTPNTVVAKGLQMSQSWNSGCQHRAARESGANLTRTGEVSKDLIILQNLLCPLFSVQLSLFPSTAKVSFAAPSSIVKAFWQELIPWIRYPGWIINF